MAVTKNAFDKLWGPISEHLTKQLDLINALMYIQTYIRVKIDVQPFPHFWKPGNRHKKP